MKKITALILTFLMISSLAAALSSCEKNGTVKLEDGEEITVIPKDEIAESGEPAQAPGSSFLYERKKLTLAKDPVYENGMIVLYFIEETKYSEDTDCYMSAYHDYEADCFMANPSPDAYPDMKTESGSYKGVALVPKEAIPAGKYNFMIELGSYVVDAFDLTID